MSFVLEKRPETPPKKKNYFMYFFMNSQMTFTKSVLIIEDILDHLRCFAIMLM